MQIEKLYKNSIDNKSFEIRKENLVDILGLIKKNSGWIILFSYSSLSNHQQSLTSNF